MTNRKHTKRALLASILSVVVCIAMLAGSTFAWFTDSVTSGKNIIKSGKLDIAASYQDVDMAAGTVSYTVPGFNCVPGGTKHTKRALLASILSVVVCIAMLAGSTFAWFTDSVTSGKNIIKSGKLDIAASYQDVDMAAGTVSYTVPGFNCVPGGTVKFAAAATDINQNNAIISEKLWEPGAVGAKLLTVRNSGSLAAKIKLNFAVNDGGLQNALWFDFQQYLADGYVAAEHDGVITVTPIK